MEDFSLFPQQATCTENLGIPKQYSVLTAARDNQRQGFILELATCIGIVELVRFIYVKTLIQCTYNAAKEDLLVIQNSVPVSEYFLSCKC